MMPNGNGTGPHWKDWLLGFTVPTCVALLGIIWNQTDKSTVKLDLDARVMQQSISMINQDIAVIKQQLVYINEQLESQQERDSSVKKDLEDYRRK